MNNIDNKKEGKDIRANTHEMTRFRNRIAVWSLLHEPVLIYGLSHGSVFELPLYRVHNEHEFGSGPGLIEWIRNTVTRD